MKISKSLILSAFIIFNTLSANAQIKMTDEQIQNVITFAHNRTSGLDHFKFYTGLKIRTLPLNNLYYQVELFKGTPQKVSTELVRFDGVRYFMSEENYEKRECIYGVATGCDVSNINYANLAGKVSLNNPEISLDNFIVIRDEIEDSALIRVLKIVNSPLENMISGKINDQIGNLLDVEINPYVTKHIITAENIDGFKPKRIHIERTIKQHRYYYVLFIHQERNRYGGFVLKIKFSGTNGNNIHLEITPGPIA